MENKEDINKLKKKISTNRINAKELSDKNYLICDGDHEKETKIREGNRLYAIIFKNESENWTVKSVCCLECNIQDDVNKFTTKYSDGALSVIESTFVIDEKDNKKFKNTDVWEYLELD